MPDQSVDTDKAIALFEQANEMAGAGRVRQAENLYTEALGIAEETPEGSALVAACLQQLASIHLSRREFAVALDEYRRLHAIAESHLGSDHPHVMDVLFQIESLLESIQSGETEIKPKTTDLIKTAVDGLIESNDWQSVGRSLRQTQTARAQEPARLLSLDLTAATVCGLLFLMLICHQVARVVSTFHASSAEANIALSGPEYVCADGTYKLRLGQHNQAEIASNNDTRALRYYAIKGIADLPMLMTSGFIYKDVSYRDERGTLIPNSGYAFYAPNGADDEILRRMHSTGKLAQNYFVEHGSYPLSEKDLAGANTPLPIQLITCATVVEFKRKIEQIHDGSAWTGEPEFQRGALHACNLVVDDVDRQKAFVIRAGSTNGKALLGQSNAPYSLMLINGSSGEEPIPNSILLDQWINRTLVVFQVPINSLVMTLLAWRWFFFAEISAAIFGTSLARILKQSDRDSRITFGIWGAFCLSLSLAFFLLILQAFA